MTNPGWETVRLGDCITLSSGGTPSKRRKEYWGGVIPWVSAKDLKVDRIYDSSDHVTQLGLLNGTKLAPAGAVLILVRGMGLANEFPVVRAMRDVAFNQDLKAVTPASGRVDPDFLYFLLRSHAEGLRALADEAAHGTKRIQTDRLMEYEVQLPALEMQRAVAVAMSAYDDLIENNTRRITILEEMAQAIYREWFVNFRFPGHEQVEMVESELGPIPAGWNVKPLSAMASHLRHNVNPGDHPTETFAHFSIPAFDAGLQPTMEEGSAISSTKHLVEDGTVLISKLNPRIPRVWMPRPPAGFRSICSTEFVVLAPQGVTRSFLFSLLKSDEFLGRLRTRAGGTSTSHQRVKPDDLLSMPVVHPDGPHIRRFTDVVDPMLSLTESLRRKNTVLRETRNLLLPKLISGEIDADALGH